MSTGQWLQSRPNWKPTTDLRVGWESYSGARSAIR